MTKTDFVPVTLVKEGDTLIADDGFTCIEAGAHLKVQRHSYGELFVQCDEGEHFLDGQIIVSQGTARYLGFTLAEPRD